MWRFVDTLCDDFGVGDCVFVEGNREFLGAILLHMEVVCDVSFVAFGFFNEE